LNGFFMLKIEVITAATEAGFFRTKSDEKLDAILTELVASNDWHANDVRAILNDESERRSAAYKARISRSVIRAQEEAEKPLTGGVDSATDHIRMMPAGRYVLTTAQNNTDVDMSMFGALITFCADQGAQLLVAKTTYNKNGFQQAADATEPLHYAAAVVPYLVTGHINLGGPIEFIADANVLPTARNVLSSFAASTGAGISAVIPAVKIALQCTAQLKNGGGKELYGTGAITKPNYIMRKAGMTSIPEHCIGALFVDTTIAGKPIVRQLEKMPDSVGFYDEGQFYGDGFITGGHQPAALQFGDVHAEKLPESMLIDMVEMLAKYKPINVILHDVCDFSSRNHHNIKDNVFIFAQHVAGNTVENDIQLVADTIDAIAAAVKPHEGMVQVIESNHDLAINTWLKNSDFKTDPVNAVTYLQCMLALYRHIERKGGDSFNMLQFAYRRIGNGDASNVAFHEIDQSLIIAGVEMGIHGHTGNNGSKGSPAQFRTMGIPLNTGHTHTPSIHGKCYTAGCMALEMGYNVGPSSWRLANILTWPNGQRQIIFM
jgi:hypothetical protein